MEAMKVALLKATARRTPNSLVTEKEEILDILPENSDELFGRLARILARGIDWDREGRRETHERNR